MAKIAPVYLLCVTVKDVTISFCTHLQQHIFNQQRLSADRMLIPHCIKPWSLYLMLLTIMLLGNWRY